MRRNQVIYNRNLSHNVSGWYGYHISKRGRLYRYLYPDTNRKKKNENKESRSSKR